MDSNTTRRSLLRIGTTAAAYAAGASMVAAGVGITSAAKSATPSGIRPAFARKIARINALAAAHRRFSDGPCKAAIARSKAMEAAIPHYTFVGGESINGGPLKLSTADKSVVAMARSFVKKPINDAEFMRAVRKLYAHHLMRERAIERAQRDSGWSAAFEKDQRFGDLTSAAEEAFFSMPSQSSAELTLKVAVMAERGGFQWEVAVEHFVADAAQLSNREG